jgi:hypothetical protein
MASLNPTKVEIVPDRGAAVTAQFNPKEIQVDKTVPWQKHKDSKADEPWLEFTGAEGRTLSMELMFDDYEDSGATGIASVSQAIADLTEMCKVKDQGGSDADRRPTLIRVKYPGLTGGVFKCVIESLSVKYTLFDGAGKPRRATVNVKFKEAERLSAAKGGG